MLKRIPAISCLLSFSRYKSQGRKEVSPMLMPVLRGVVIVRGSTTATISVMI